MSVPSVSSVLAPLWAKAILGLSLALVLSLAGNALLVRHMLIAQGEARGESARQQLAAENTAYKQKTEIETALGARATEDHATLLADLSAIAERGQRFSVRYRNAAAAKPLGADCAPGQARVDAVNAFLGPRQGDTGVHP